MTDKLEDAAPDSVSEGHTAKERQQRGLKRGKNHGNKGGRSYPQTYKMWLKGLLDSEKHRKEFAAQMENGEAPNFKFATEHAAAHAYGKPTQTVELDAQVQITVRQGLGLKKGDT